ncbi:TPA: hypothetical protein PBP70_004144 [Escherichia coli]|nr:hypothetical protein [Escherichia coli]
METNTLLRVVVRRTRISIRHGYFISNDLSLKSQDITRKRTAKFFCLYGVVKFNSTVHFRLWQSAKWRGGKYGGVILTPISGTGLSG